MTRVLVPVAVLEGETVSAGLVGLLGTVDVTVLGYHELPEQTPTDQARLQYEERATEALSDLVDEFRDAGAGAEYRLVFTHDREQTIDRVADETGSRAFAITGTTGPVQRLLVALTGDVAVDRIVDFVATVIADREIRVTLLVPDAVDTDGTPRHEPALERLRDAGVAVEAESAEGSPFDALVDAVPGHDAIVLGGTAPSLRSFLLGDLPERVAAASVGPVLVVRRTEEADAAEEEGRADTGQGDTAPGDEPGS